MKNWIKTPFLLMLLIGVVSCEKESLSDVIVEVENETIITFERLYERNGVNSGHHIIQLADGSYFMTGNSATESGEVSSLNLIKLDKEGNIEWEKEHQGEHSDVGVHITIAPNGGYLISGYSVITEPRDNNIFMIRVNNAGETIWEKRFGTTDYDQIRNVVLSDDGNYILAGTAGEGEAKMYLAKMNDEGNMIWEKYYGNSMNDNTYRIVKVTSGGYAILGESENGGSYVLKVDENGNMEWDNTVGNPKSSATGFSVTKDGGYVIAGHVWSSASTTGNAEIQLIKLGRDGQLVWGKTYPKGIHTFATGVVMGKDGGYIIQSNSFLDEDTLGGIFLHKIDENGELQWERTFSVAAKNATTGFMEVTSDGGFILTGIANFLSSDSDFYIIKTDSEGNI